MNRESVFEQNVTRQNKRNETVAVRVIIHIREQKCEKVPKKGCGHKLTV